MTTAEELFSERGFNGTTLRELARAADVSQPLLYHYFASKHDLLVALCQQAVNGLIDAIEDALATCPTDPDHRLDALVTAHVEYEISTHRRSFVANTEVRSLDPAARAAFESKRAHVQGHYDRTIVTGTTTGSFRTPYPQETARAVASMCIAVNSWYRDGGPLRSPEIARRYSTMARLMVGSQQLMTASTI